MQKLNKKGFFLAETMIVVGIAVTVLVMFYKQISNLYTNYEYTVRYNTVQDIHAANNLKLFVNQEGKTDLINALGSKPYLDIDTDYNFPDATYYSSLKIQSNISKVYMVTYNKINALIANAVSYNFNASFITYLKTLSLIDSNNPINNNKYLLIVQLNDGTFTNIMIDNSDIIPPYITLLGQDNIVLDVGATYTDAGATARDNLEGDISARISKTGNVTTAVPGIYKITYTVSDNVGNKASPVTRTVNVIEFDYAYDYTGNYQTFTVPYSGIYLFELWGAQGGNSTYNSDGSGGVGVLGGNGAYTKGKISLSQGENIYIYVGGKGGNGGIVTGVRTAGGYNGGGQGGYAYQVAGGGGGASDIRLQSGTWNNLDSLRSRIMVAAGGGGASNWTNANAGGYAGGLTGQGGQLNSGSVAHTLAGGGTQTTGGNAGGSSGVGSPGDFGIGGNSDPAHGGGGGSGYYGGGGGGVISGGVSSGAGGSSFVSGYSGCNAITPSGAASGQATHYSQRVFTESDIKAGNQLMPNPRGAGTITGNSGAGYAKITFNP